MVLITEQDMWAKTKHFKFDIIASEIHDSLYNLN